jgi:hypothetical protein
MQQMTVIIKNGAHKGEHKIPEQFINIIKKEKMFKHYSGYGGNSGFETFYNLIEKNGVFYGEKVKN